ncbi:hypothetical protein AC244_24470 [Ensifer adhaerens]|uniref:Uncharacterized protein n=1 Tax=Ensifer adhaerens TaxID=106592 RepID=A0A0L8BKM7_ENSAD|nr:hypothetical protein AC244_24470 [Ensifer adhaerens]
MPLILQDGKIDRRAYGGPFDLVQPVHGRLCMPEPDAPSAAVAMHMFAKQFDAGAVERFDDFRQAIDDASHVAPTGFHSLDCWQGDPSHLGHGFLIDIEECAGGTKLGGGNQRGVRVCI